MTRLAVTLEHSADRRTRDTPAHQDEHGEQHEGYHNREDSEHVATIQDLGPSASDNQGQRPLEKFTASYNTSSIEVESAKAPQRSIEVGGRQ